MYRTIGERVFGREQMHPLLKSELIGHWIGGGSGLTWFDQSGYGNHGAITGPLWSLGQGDKRSALAFDGANDYVAVGDVNRYDFANTAPFSVTVWWKAPVSPTTTQALVAKQLTTGASTGWGLLILGASAGDPYRVNLIANNAGPDQIIANFTRSNDENWHHTCFTYDGSGVIAGVKLYEDATDIAEIGGITNTLSTTMANSVSLEFGARVSGTNSPFTGILGDIRIYNRTLSQAEVVLLARSS